MVEILLSSILLVVALAFFVDKLTKFCKQFKISDAKKMLTDGKEIHIDCKISAKNKKSRADSRSTHNQKNLD